MAVFSQDQASWSHVLLSLRKLEGIMYSQRYGRWKAWYSVLQAVPVARCAPQVLLSELFPMQGAGVSWVTD